MSSEKYIPFGVKASNLASVANFSSTLEDSYILIIANNCNTPVDNGNSYDNVYNSLNNAALFGVNVMNTSVNNNQEAYIGIKNNELSHKIAKFNRENINLDVNTIINGNLCPTINSNYDIGSLDNQWKNLYLSESLFADNIYGDGSGLSNVNLLDRTTSELIEGSNLYFTNDRFYNNLFESTLDQIQDGTSNRFIHEGSYVGDMKVEGILTVDSIVIKKFENLPDDTFNISNFITEIVAKSTSYVKEGSNLYFTNERTGILIDSSNVNISNYILDTSNNIIHELIETSNKIQDYIFTNDSNMSNFLLDAIDNNVNMSNYISETSNSLINEIYNSSNDIINLSISHDTNVSNYVYNISNNLIEYVDTKQLNITGAASTVVNSLLSSRSVVTTNISGRITSSTVSVTELEYLKDTRSKVQTQIDELSNKINITTADAIVEGTSNKYIVNDVYDNDLHIEGALYATNLFIEGDSTTINTTTYETENLYILSKDADGPSLIISHESPLHNILEASNNGDMIFCITNNNNVGIGIDTPQERLEVSGNIKAIGFIGNGSLLTDVNITDSTTSYLPEGSNLYFTSERVGELIDGSNIGISNYIWITSNILRSEIETYIEDEITITSNDIIRYSIDLGLGHSNYVNKKYLDSLTYTSYKELNISNFVIHTSNNIATSLYTNDTNISNYLQTTSNTLVTNIDTNDTNISNYLQTTSNTLVTNIDTNDTNISNYLQTTSNTLVTNIDTNDTNISNYLQTTSNTLVTNIDTNDTNISNYLQTTSNTLLTNIDTNDTNISNYLQTTSNTLVTNIDTYDTNISNYLQTTSNTLVTNIDTYDTNISNYLQTTSNTLVTNIDTNDVNISNYLQTTSNTLVTNIGTNDTNISNYLQTTSNTLLTNIDTNDTNISNYLETTSNTLLTNIDTNDTNISNYLQTTSNTLLTNIDTNDTNISNYLQTTSNTLLANIDTYDTNISNYLQTTSNTLLTNIDTNDVNISNYLHDTSNAIAFSLNSLNQLVRNDLQTKLDDTSNFVISMDSNISNYVEITSNTISDRISKLDADDIAQGENKRFIVNNVWSDDLTISGTLYTSNIRAVGSNTIIFTDIYTTESLGVVSTAEDSDAFVISHSGEGIYNVMTATVADEPAMVITSQRYVGIGLTNPSNALEVIGVTKSSEFIGVGSNIDYVLTNYTTSDLLEGNNMYYTHERVGKIVLSSNIETSNYIDDTKSNISNYLKETSNIITSSLNLLNEHVRNDINIKLNETSNFVISMNINVSNYIDETVSNISIINSNINDRISQLSADNLANGTSNKFIINDTIDSDLNVTGGIDVKYLIIDGVKFEADSYVPELNPIIYNLDLMTDGTSNRYIKDNVYNDNLKISGDLEVNNLLINNKISLINNSVYSSECLEVVNITDSTSIKVSQIGTGDIFNIENDYEEIFVMKNNGYFGNVSEPLYNIDINGIINATYIRGDGSQMSNVNIVGNNTSDLTEGSNLYFTEDRVYQILYSSNYQASNIFKSSIDSLYISIDDIKSALLCINIDNIVQGSVNKYIVSNIYNDSLVVNGTLTVRDIQIMDIDNNYSNIYTSNLYKCPGNGIMEMSQNLNISNIVNDILSNISFTDDEQTSNIVFNNIQPIYSDIYDINSNLESVNQRIDGINANIETRNADYFHQGTSNKFIKNDIYDGSMFVNGVLTVRGINIIDVDDYDPSQDSVLQNFNVQDVYTTNANISNIVRTILSQENFENQINNTYELMVYAIERETALLSNRLNAQANEISLLKNNIETLTNIINSSSS